MKAKELFEILVRENATSLTAFIRSSSCPIGAVDDIWQETMLVAWKRIDDFDRDRPFGPWLRGIASRLILEGHRKVSRRATCCSESTLEYLNEQFNRIHQFDGDTLNEKLSALRACVSQLPDHYQRPIELRYSGKLGPNELSQTLQLTVETVKKRLYRARAILARCITAKLELTESRLAGKVVGNE